MSDKYIIKNCPCYVQYENSLHLCCDGQGDGECQDCTDCVMKQIVELCKKIISRNGKIDFKEGFSNLAVGENFVARKILKLLDIQEVK